MENIGSGLNASGLNGSKQRTFPYSNDNKNPNRRIQLDHAGHSSDSSGVFLLIFFFKHKFPDHSAECSASTHVSYALQVDKDFDDQPVWGVKPQFATKFFLKFFNSRARRENLKTKFCSFIRSYSFC